MQLTKINFHAKCKNKAILVKEAEAKDFTFLLQESLVYGDNVGIKEFVVKQLDKKMNEEKDNCTCCPECGSKEYVNKNLVGDGYRMCRECHQDWWTDIKYNNEF